MKKYYIIFSFLLIHLAGCNNKRILESDTLIISVDPQKDKVISNKEWISQIELIPLETSKSSLLNGCSKMMVYLDRYYIFDQKQKAVFVFDSNGKFLYSTLPMLGKGPKEYSSMTDFDINKYSGNLEFLDPFSASINIYDKDGTYVKKISLPRSLLPLSKFKRLSDEMYLFYARKQKKTIQLYSTDKKKVIKSYGAIPQKTYYLPITNQYPFYELNNELHFTHIFANNEVYKVDTVGYTNMFKVMEYDFGKYNFTLDNLPDEQDKAFYNRFLLENSSRFVWVFNKSENEFIHIAFIYFQNKPLVLRYNKQTKHHDLVNHKFKEGSILLAPSFLDNVYMYCISEPIDILNLVDSDLLDLRSKNILSQIKEEDNPVIIKYKLKY
ncbi:MAG: 6-bladed beta-propeller [Bacteroidales bacterium]|jgi:hypothetical protein|nr:6-bladed beta-propeller [Bacteroidales bacterium]